MSQSETHVGPAPRQILVIDDDQATLDTYARILRLADYQVITALSADAALHAVDSGRPDAILLDLRMPEVDGLAFLRQLRGRPDARHLPVAIVTGDYLLHDTTTSAELAERGATVYFKPLWLEELSAVVESLLDHPSPE